MSTTLPNKITTTSLLERMRFLMSILLITRSSDLIIMCFLLRNRSYRHAPSMLSYPGLGLSLHFMISHLYYLSFGLSSVLYFTFYLPAPPVFYHHITLLPNFSSCPLWYTTLSSSLIPFEAPHHLSLYPCLLYTSLEYKRNGLQTFIHKH